LHLGLITLTALATPAVFELLYALAARMHLPHGYAAALAAVVAAGAVLALAGPFLVPRPMPDALIPLVPADALAQLAATDDTWRAALAVGCLAVWAAAASGLVWLAIQFPQRPAEAEYTRLLVGAPVPRGRIAAGVAAHAFALIRL